jgi:hypothetical protein
VREAERSELELARTMELPGVPQVGDEVRALDRCELLKVLSVEWILDPGDEEAHVIAFLDDLDSDQFGPMDFAAEILLDRGWKPLIEL